MTSKKPSQDFNKGEWSGRFSGVTTPGQFIAKTQEEWETIWNAAHSSVSPAPKAPKLPKGKMAVAVFAGQTSASINLAIESVSEKNGTISVEYSQTANRASMLAVMTEAYVLKFIDHSDLPVTFTKAQKNPAPQSPGNLKNLPGKKSR